LFLPTARERKAAEVPRARARRRGFSAAV